MGLSCPVIRKIGDNQTALDDFERNFFQKEDKTIWEIIASFPTVYIHKWKRTCNYDIYIGESNNEIGRAHV